MSTVAEEEDQDEEDKKNWSPRNKTKTANYKTLELVELNNYKIP